MLHEFLSFNRDELIARCRTKVSRRDSPAATTRELEHGVPLFLEQLVWALRCEQESPGLDRDPAFGPPRKTPAAVESSRTAALHGKELLDDGYSVNQVVHDYGDICQAITELAEEKDAPIGIDEFRTFNRLLDSAIADAVAAYGYRRDEPMSALLDTAVNAFDALKLGNIGLRGATGALLEQSLAKLREIIDRPPPKP